MIKISFIVPVYNVEKYLSECLDSLVRQTYGNIEIIAVNDGSTDKSGEILSEYACNDNRIKVINQSNQGLSVARNVGMRYVTGDYILFVDSDDYIALHSVELLVSKIKSCDSDVPDIVIFSRRNLYSSTYYRDEILSEADTPITDGMTRLLEDIASNRLRASVCNKLISTELLHKTDLLFIPKILYEDLSFSIHALVMAHKVTAIPDVLYIYRRNNFISITNTVSPRDVDVLVTIETLHQFLIDSGYDEIADSAIWQSFICKWVCNATFFKYPLKSFYSKQGWLNSMKIKANPLFREYLRRTVKTPSNRLNLRVAAQMININIAFFYVIRKITKLIFPKYQF